MSFVALFHFISNFSSFLIFQHVLLRFVWELINVPFLYLMLSGRKALCHVAFKSTRHHIVSHYRILYLLSFISIFQFVLIFPLCPNTRCLAEAATEQCIQFITDTKLNLGCQQMWSKQYLLPHSGEQLFLFSR